MSAIWLTTICANLCLLAFLCWRRPAHSRLLWIAQWEAVIATAVMLTANYTLPPDHGLNDEMFNAIWTAVDMMNAFAEVLAIRWAWCRCKDFLASLVMISLGVHLYIKHIEYWSYDQFHPEDWMPSLHHRQWLNVFNILMLAWLVQRKCAPAQEEQHMDLSITKADALAKLAASEFAAESDAIMAILFPPAASTNDSLPDGDDGSGPRNGGGH